MISTLYLLQFIAFYLWQITTRHVKREKNPVSALSRYVLQNKMPARTIGVILLLIALVGFIFTIGLMSGVCGFIVGLMCMGCLSVVLTPFGYLRLPGVTALYITAFLLEILI